MVKCLLLISIFNLCGLVLSQASAPGLTQGLDTHRDASGVSKPELDSIQYYIDELTAQGNLFARALKVSNLYNFLTSDKYPFVVFFVPSTDGQLERYLARQGLTPKAFLKHPKLRQFMESHLILRFVDTEQPRPLGKRKQDVVTYAINGYKIVLRTPVSYKPKSRDYRLRIANGKVFGPGCLHSGPYLTTAYSHRFEGQICFLNGPIFKDFDWSLGGQSRTATD